MINPTTPLTRRSMLAGATALGVTLLSGRGSVAQPATPVATPGWETHAGAPGELALAWNPARWMLLDEPDAGRDATWLVDTDAGPEASSGQYLLAASHTALPWTTLSEVAANALAWRFPTRTPTVLDAWETDDATGFASVGGDADDRGFNYLEFSALDTGGNWRDIVISIPVAAFDADRARKLYRSVTVDGEAIPQATDLDVVIDTFARHIRLKE